MSSASPKVTNMFSVLNQTFCILLGNRKKNGHSPPSVAEIKSGEAILLFPHTSSWHGA
jgi:hypothetical protein